MARGVLLLSLFVLVFSVFAGAQTDSDSVVGSVLSFADRQVVFSYGPFELTHINKDNRIVKNLVRIEYFRVSGSDLRVAFYVDGKTCGSDTAGQIGSEQGVYYSKDVESLLSARVGGKLIPNRLADFRAFVVALDASESRLRNANLDKLPGAGKYFGANPAYAGRNWGYYQEHRDEDAGTYLTDILSSKKLGSFWNCYNYKEYLDTFKIASGSVSPDFVTRLADSERKQAMQNGGGSAGSGSSVGRQPFASREVKPMVAAPSPSAGTRPQFPAAAKSEPKAAAAQQGVVSDFIIQTPEEAAAKPKPGSLQPGQEFTLKNAIFTKKPEFRYVLRFKKGSPVTGYRIVFTRIADLDLKKTVSTGEQGKAPYLPLGDTFAKKEKIGENHFRGSLILADLPDGVYKIYAQVTSGGQSSTTYWLPEFTGDILDGVVILDKAGKYKDKQQYVETVDKNYYVLKYGAEKTEKFYPLLVEARNARKSLDASGDSIQRFIRREGFVRKLLELARVKANVAFKEKPREKYEAVQKQVYRDLWADKLADLYLPLEKGLAAEKRTLCDKPLWETSPSSPKYSDPMHDESYQCFSTQQRDEAKVRKETEVKLVYLEYMVAGLNVYKKDKGSLSLEDAVDALNKWFVQYLAATASSIKKETNRLEAIYKDDVIPNENGLALKTPGVRKQAAGRGAGPAVDLPTTFNIKISEKTCSRVNSLAFSGGLPKVNELESGPVLPSDAKAFGGASSGDAITPGGYSMLLQFCKNYAKFWNADKVLQYAKSHKALPSSVLSAKGDKPASTRYSAENPKMEREILAYLTDQSRRFEQYGAYNEIGNIAFFKGAAQQPDPALATKFNFAKCIEPYTTPSFAVATLGFVGLAALTGGSSVAATLVGGAGDAMMVVSAMQLAGSKEADVNRIACDFAFFALSVPMSATVGKVREKAVELKKAKLDAKAREAFDLFARGVEAKAKAEVPKGSYEIMDPFKGVSEGAGREPKKKMTFECAFAASAACGGEAQSFTSRGISREPPAASDTLPYSFFERTLAETYVHVRGNVIRYSQNPQGASGVFYKTNQGVQYQTLDPYSSLTVEHGGQSATVSPNQGVTVQPGMTLRLGGLMEIKISAPEKKAGWFENLFTKKANEQAKPPQDEPKASQKQQGKPPKAEPETLTWRGGEDGRSAAGTLDAGAVEVESAFGFNSKHADGYGEMYGAFRTKPPYGPADTSKFIAEVYGMGLGRILKSEETSIFIGGLKTFLDEFALTVITGDGRAYLFKTENANAYIIGKNGARPVKSRPDSTGIDVTLLEITPGEKVVLTTKGVHQVVSEAEIGNIVKQYGSTEKAIIGILSKAKQRSDPSKTYRTDDGQTVRGLLDDASVTIHDYNPAKAGDTTPPKQESARPPGEQKAGQKRFIPETGQVKGTHIFIVKPGQPHANFKLAQNEFQVSGSQGLLNFDTTGPVDIYIMTLGQDRLYLVKKYEQVTGFIFDTSGRALPNGVDSMFTAGRNRGGGITGMAGDPGGLIFGGVGSETTVQVKSFLSQKTSPGSGARPKEQPRPPSQGSAQKIYVPEYSDMRGTYIFVKKSGSSTYEMLSGEWTRDPNGQEFTLNFDSLGPVDVYIMKHYVIPDFSFYPVTEYKQVTGLRVNTYGKSFQAAVGADYVPRAGARRWSGSAGNDPGGIVFWADDGFKVSGYWKPKEGAASQPQGGAEKPGAGARPEEKPPSGNPGKGNRYAETVQSDSDGKSATAFILPKNSPVSGAGFNSQPGREMYAVFRSKDNSLPLDAISEQLSRDYSSGAPSVTIRGNIERSNADGTVILVDRDRVYRFSSADTPVRTYVLRSTGQFEHINQLGGYMDLRTGDKVIMLSSDVYNAVSVSELKGILSSHRNLKDALTSLLNRVRERSGSLAGEREGAVALGFEYDANRVGTPSAGNGGQQAGTPGSRPQQGAGASGQLLIAGKPIASNLGTRYLDDGNLKTVLNYFSRTSDGVFHSKRVLTDDDLAAANIVYRKLVASYHPEIVKNKDGVTPSQITDSNNIGVELSRIRDAINKER